MGHLFLALSLCAPAARGADDPAARALVRVVVAEKNLDKRARQHHDAVRDKSKAGQEAIAAAKKLAESRGEDKAEARADVVEAKRDLRAARGEAKQTQGAFVASGRNYIAAEDAYHSVTGAYHDEQRYDRVRERLRMDPRPGTPEPGPPDPAVPDDALIAAINAGQVTTPEMERRAEQLSLAGEEAVTRALAGGFPAAGSLPTDPDGTTESGGGAPARVADAPPRADGPAGSPGLDRAVMLSRPAGNQDAAASGRFLAAGGERLRVGDAAGALAAAEAALKANPRDAKAWALKAAALNKLRRFAEAETAAERAVALDPSDARAYRDLAWAQLHLGKADEAAKNATRMIFLDPDNPEGYLLRALAYELKGDRARMLADLERAAALDPRYANHLARARAGLRLFDPAAADTDSLLGALDPLPAPPSNALVRFGVLLLSLGALAGAALAVRARAARPAAPAPSAPPLLAGKYRLRRVVGQGTSGQVWEADDVTLDRLVAVKELAREPARRDACLESARAAATLRHPNIAELYEVLELPSDLYLVSEWVPGQSLERLLAERKRLSVDAAKTILTAACDALAFAHGHGVCHGGVTPANILVAGDGSVKLSDFGFRRPTAAEGEFPTPAADVYALGVCLHLMLTGELPSGKPPAGLPPAVDAFLARALSPDPAARFPDPPAFKAALLAL